MALYTWANIGSDNDGSRPLLIYLLSTEPLEEIALKILSNTITISVIQLNAFENGWKMMVFWTRPQSVNI